MERAAGPGMARAASRGGGGTAVRAPRTEGRAQTARRAERPARPLSGSARRRGRAAWVRAVASDVESEKRKKPPGVPERLGGHLMPSGEVAPLSASVTVGTGELHQFQYPDDMGVESTVQIHPDEPAAVAAAADGVISAANEAIGARGSFAIAISGGSALGVLESAASRETDWSRWHVFFADERVVPRSDADSNFRAASERFLSRVAIPGAQVYPIAEGLGLVRTAAAYEISMAAVAEEVLPRVEGVEGGDDAPLPRFDYVLLGCGPDAHVASLFPNRPEVGVTSRWIVPVGDAPKPPPSRISLSLPVINAAAHIAVFATGYSKSEAMQRVLEVNALPGALPAQMVRPREGGDLVYYLDAAAASDLHLREWEDHSRWPRNELPKPEKKKK